MSSRSKPPKSSKSKKSDDRISKNIPTSVEFIVDSDIEATSDEEKGNLYQRTESRSINGTSPGKSSKRKAVNETNSGRSKKMKTDKPVQKTTTTNIAPRRSSLSSSSDLSSDAPNSQVSGTLTKSAKLPLEPEVSSSNEDEETEGSVGDDHDTEDDGLSTEGRRERADIRLSLQNKIATTVIPPYYPPEDMPRAIIDEETSTSLRNMFSADALQGKQIWLIMAPEKVPMSNIKQFTYDDLANGKTLLEHKGTEYGFSIDNEDCVPSSVLIPARKGARYDSISKNIHQTIHLRQVIAASKVATQSKHKGNPSRPISGSRKKILKQPTGLRMRHQPLGDANKSKNKEQAIQQAMNRISNAQIPIPPTSTVNLLLKKTKKAKSDSLDAERIPEMVDPNSYSAPLLTESQSQHTIDLPEEPIGHDQVSNVNGETPEERAKRKAEKAARKEERRKRREAKASATV